MTVLGIELRKGSWRWAGPGFALAICCLVWVHRWPLLETAHHVAESHLLAVRGVSALVAGCAAWDADRWRRAGCAPLLVCASRSGRSARQPQLMAMAVWLVGAWTAGVVASVAVAWAGGARITDCASVHLAALMHLLGFAAFGTACALLLRRWWCSVVATTVTIGLQVASGVSGMPALADRANPFRMIGVNAGAEVDTAGVLLLALGTLAAGAGLLGVPLLLRSSRPRALAGVCVACFAVVVATGLSLNQRGPALTHLPSQPQWVELNGEHVRLRVVRDYAPAGPELVAAWDRVSVLLSESDLAFEHLQQDLRPVHAPSPGFSRLTLRADVRDLAARSIEEAWRDVSGCTPWPGRPPAGDGDLGPMGDVLAMAWLSRGDRLPPTVVAGGDLHVRALAWLNGLTSLEARAWWRDHARNVRECRWSSSDFGLR